MKNFGSLLVIIIFATVVQGQVNTENLRKLELEKGFYNNLQFDFGLATGNSEFLKMKGNLRTDFVAKNYYAFGVLQYQRGTQANEVFLNKGFAHLRSIRHLDHKFGWEFFVQKEFNEFISLKDRNLIGTGLRTAFFLPKNIDFKSRYFYFFVGLGAMWENEKIKTPKTETKIFRSTNYLSIRWKVDDRINVGLVSYYQFDLSRYRDYRILMESSTLFKITKSLALTTSLNLRFDNEPPTDIKKYDIEITNGLSFSF